MNTRLRKTLLILLCIGTLAIVARLCHNYFFEEPPPFIYSEERFNELKQNAETGDPEAQYQFGLYYNDGTGIGFMPGWQDHTEAVKWFRRAAFRGHPEAQANLGGAYCLGNGVQQDFVEGFKWNLKAAEQGVAEAQHNVGWSYSQGYGVSKDPAEGVKWYLKAAAQGLESSQANLGLAYYNGVGVKKDYVEAYAYLSIVAPHDDMVKEVLDELTKKVSKDVVLAGQKRAAQIIDEIEPKWWQLRWWSALLSKINF